MHFASLFDCLTHYYVKACPCAPPINPVLPVFPVCLKLVVFVSDSPWFSAGFWKLRSEWNIGTREPRAPCSRYDDFTPHLPHASYLNMLSEIMLCSLILPAPWRSYLSHIYMFFSKLSNCWFLNCHEIKKPVLTVIRVVIFWFLCMFPMRTSPATLTKWGSLEVRAMFCFDKPSAWVRKRSTSTPIP